MAREGRDGRDGQKGDPGIPGADGRPGRDGARGEDGQSAYLLAKAAGFPGDQAEYLRSLRGTDGAAGQSAYDAARALGFVGSEEDWLASLQGPQGRDGVPGRVGVKGNTGDQGPPGPIGPMPKHVWKGTQLSFELAPGVWGAFVDLQGPKGEDGAQGITRAIGGGGGGGSGGVPEAPNDNLAYARSNSAWVVTVEEAPEDSQPYVRKNGAWFVAVSGGSATWGNIVGTLSDQTDLQSALDLKANTADLATVATTGAYSDLTGKPTLGTAAAHAATDFATAAQGAEADTAVQPGDLATVATTGAYSDLSGTPSLAAIATSGSAADLTSGQLADARVKASNVTQFQTSLSIAWSQITSAPTTLSGYGITDAAPLASPALTGTPTAPTPSTADNTTKIATTAYVQAQGYVTAASAPVVSVAGKTGVVTLAVADVSGAAPLASPTFTGTVTIPTPSGGDNSTKAASTAFVVAAFAPIASPTFTGTPTAPTASPGTNSTQIATTAYADAIAALKANIASPTFTGTPAGPTASAGTHTTQLATTAFVTNGKTVTALTISSGVVNIDYSLGNYFTLALSANVTSFTASNLPASGFAQTIWIEITQNASSAKTVSFSGLSFKWAGGVAGVVSSALSAVDELAITTLDQGTSYKSTLAKAFA